MTIKNALTLQNLLILLCIAVLVLIGFKTFEVNRKMSTLAEADTYYGQKNFIRAEELYRQAADNRSLRYKEKHINSRLNELAPITEMKQTLSDLDSRALHAETKQDLEALIKVYGEMQEAKAKYMNPSARFASLYPEISASYGLSDDVTRYFQQFKARFYEQMKNNLDKADYSDETFKWNLLSIPEAFYGNADQKAKQLRDKFKAYDEAKLSQLASAGQFTALLDQSLGTIQAYNNYSYKADWIPNKTEELTRIILEKDVDGEQIANFISHAGAYKSFVAAANIQSGVTKYVDKQISKWMKTAQSKVKNAEFQEAIAMYEALSSYHDTSDEIKAANLAWTIHDPIRLLQAADATHSYAQVSGGGNRFGDKAYAIGMDEANTLYFASINNEDQTELLSTSQFPQHVEIRQITIEKALSTKNKPVILVEGISGDRKALYGAYEVQEGNIAQLFLIDADGYEVQQDGTLLVTNPADGQDQTAIYERRGDAYEFAGYQKDYTDIGVDNLLGYSNEKVRFTCMVVQGGTGTALAQMGDSYLLLKGNMTFYEGNMTVIGTFSQFEDIYPDGDQLGDLISVPVVEVDSQE